ncbi:lipopolysaccharide assembly LapA domain-containing protein [Paenibacillus sp. NEAU-GSW1]|uniref:LapA family protein n=1 Tax=Paenibacillus sp. NEAU-GSW1 TaxID=2682486 RepID=UPI0012E1B35F|nr:lipopolysaccharide assembly protein LapA domain-containing protein [Paenibacillus sp. NEAU-GSW1]MUT68440.1 DUF1049 domain-containing protein [Paenibacillus sp. NEAU-GSW1]
MKGQSLLIAALAFAFVIALFAVINVDSVQVNFLFTKTNIPLILVILASTLLGGLTVGLFGGIRQFKLQRSVRSLEKRIAELTAGQQPEYSEKAAGANAEPVFEKANEGE